MTRDPLTLRIEAALPFWLDRPDEEALDIAVEVGRAGLDALWVGEMATFDAFALGAAIGQRAPALALKLGPLAVGVRSPVAIALGVSSVAALSGSRVDVALGASSPAIVAGWHDREWAAQRRAHARDDRVPASDLRRGRARVRRAPCAQPRLPAAPPAAGHPDRGRRIRARL